MSLSFKWLHDNSIISEFSLDDKRFTLLKPAFEELKKKTGLRIDPYKDARISPEQALLLKQNILELFPDHVLKVQGFVEILKVAVNKSRWILAIGD